MIRESLGVPAELTVTFEQSDPQYWNARERWLVDVSIYEGDSCIATASVDPQILELCRNILQYFGN